jgi:integrase
MGVKVREKLKRSGVWWVFINHKGARKAVKVGSREVATAKAKEVEAALTLGKLKLNPPETPPPVLFGEFAERFMGGHVEINLKHSTKVSYREALDRNVLPVFGKRPLHEITRPEIKDFCHGKIRQGLSTGSVRVLITIISSIFNHALEDGLVSVNPAEKPGKYLKTPAKEKAEFLTPDECNVLLDAARKHSPRLYPLYLMALRTGMRQGEILALEWGDIDSHGGFIEVRRTNYLGHIGTPKNGKTRRVDMSDGLREALAHHKRKLAEEYLALGQPVPEWVFPNEEGKPFWAPNLRKRFDTCLGKAGLRRVPFHALRHSYASALIALGEPLAYVQAQLGHASIAQTVDTYGHMIEGANRKAVNKLDDLGKSATPAQPAVLG